MLKVFCFIRLVEDGSDEVRGQMRSEVRCLRCSAVCGSEDSFSVSEIQNLQPEKIEYISTKKQNSENLRLLEIF